MVVKGQPESDQMIYNYRYQKYTESVIRNI